MLSAMKAVRIPTTGPVDVIELAGETVIVWWGLFDQELWVEHGEERCGPFLPVGGTLISGSGCLMIGVHVWTALLVQEENR